MPFLTRSQLRQSTEGNEHQDYNLASAIIAL